MASRTSAFGVKSRERHDASSFYRRKLYRERKTVSDGSLLSVRPTDVDIIYQADSRNMSQLPDNSVHLMITSPPYNVGKEYDADLTCDEYCQLLARVISECYRVLVDGGRACVNIANVGRSPYIPLHAYVIDIAHHCGFLMRGEIIWDKGASAGVSCAWGSWRSASNPVLRDVHEYILVFSKNTFARAGDKKNTIGRDDFIACTKSIWRLNTVSAKKIGHPAPFPVELPTRLIDLYSYRDDIVLDPFIGSGSTALAARATDRHYIGYEINADYVQLANARLQGQR